LETRIPPMRRSPPRSPGLRRTTLTQSVAVLSCPTKQRAIPGERQRHRAAPKRPLRHRAKTRRIDDTTLTRLRLNRRLTRGKDEDCPDDLANRSRHRDGGVRRLRLQVRAQRTPSVRAPPTRTRSRLRAVPAPCRRADRRAAQAVRAVVGRVERPLPTRAARDRGRVRRLTTLRSATPSAGRGDVERTRCPSLSARSARHAT
jgi:hypothetical protein